MLSTLKDFTTSIEMKYCFELYREYFDVNLFEYMKTIKLTKAFTAKYNSIHNVYYITKIKKPTDYEIVSGFEIDQYIYILMNIRGAVCTAIFNIEDLLNKSYFLSKISSYIP
jgi:hypothetical protein